MAHAGLFEYNPSGFGGTNGTFSGDELVGRFSTALESTDEFATFNADGWFQVQTVNLGSTAQLTGGLDSSGPNASGTYQLWAEFQYAASGGPGGGIALTYDIDSFSFDLYAGSGTDRDFILSTDSSGTGPDVVTNSGSETLLGNSSNTLGGGIVNFQNQSFLALDADFELENLGTFFTAPDPFFDLVFQSASTVLPILNNDLTAGTLKRVNGSTVWICP